MLVSVCVCVCAYVSLGMCVFPLYLWSSDFINSFNVRIIAVITEGSWGTRKELSERWFQRQPSATGKQEGFVSESQPQGPGW